MWRGAKPAVGALAALVLGLPGLAQAADPGRWRETGRSTMPLSYYQGLASDGAKRIFFDGYFSGLYRTGAALDQRAANDSVIPASVSAKEGYNHIGDIAWDARGGGRVLLPAECYYPGTQGSGPDPANTCKTGSIGVADPNTLKWRYHVKLDPAEVPKAMWVAVSPNGKLIWTQSGDDLLAYSMDDISLAHAAPTHAPIEAVRRLANILPSGSATGGAFYGGRLYVAGNGKRLRVWSIALATGKRRLEIEKRIQGGEAEGLDVFTGLGGDLHWLVQRTRSSGLFSFFYGNGLLLHLVPHGAEPTTPRARLARIVLTVSPHQVERGKQTELTFTAAARVAGTLGPVDGATVHLGTLSATTDLNGRATIAFRAETAGKRVATASRQNLRAGSTSITVTNPGR